jgi:hypothetical protein
MAASVTRALTCECRPALRPLARSSCCARGELHGFSIRARLGNSHSTPSQPRRRRCRPHVLLRVLGQFRVCAYALCARAALPADITSLVLPACALAPCAVCSALLIGRPAERGRRGRGRGCGRRAHRRAPRPGRHAPGPGGARPARGDRVVSPRRRGSARDQGSLSRVRGVAPRTSSWRRCARGACSTHPARADARRRRSTTCSTSRTLSRAWTRTRTVCSSATGSRCCSHTAVLLSAIRGCRSGQGTSRCQCRAGRRLRCCRPAACSS